MRHNLDDKHYICNHECPIHLKVLSKKENSILTRLLSDKARLYLKNKYYRMILDKSYNLGDFSLQIIKEINDFNYYNNPNKSQLFRIIENKFLRLLNSYDESRREVLSTKKLKDLISQTNYQFNKLNQKDLNINKPVYKTANKKENRIKDIKDIERRKGEEEIFSKIEQKLIKSEKDFLQIVTTVNAQGLKLKNNFESKQI